MKNLKTRWLIFLLAVILLAAIVLLLNYSPKKNELNSSEKEQVIEPARHKALIWTEKKLQIEQGKLL